MPVKLTEVASSTAPRPPFEEISPPEKLDADPEAKRIPTLLFSTTDVLPNNEAEETVTAFAALLFPMIQLRTRVNPSMSASTPTCWDVDVFCSIWQSCSFGFPSLTRITPALDVFELTEHSRMVGELPFWIKMADPGSEGLPPLIPNPSREAVESSPL